VQPPFTELPALPPGPPLKPLKDDGMVAYDVSPNSTSPTTSVALHPLSTVAAADSLVMSMMLINSGGVNPTGSVTATDTQGNTYVQVGTTRTDNGGDFLVSLAAVNIHKALSTTDTITVNWPSNKEHFIAVEDFTGVTAVDQTTTASTLPSPLPGPFSSGYVTTTAANELLYGFAGFTGGSLPVWDTGWAPGNMALVTNRTDRLLTSARLVNSLGAYQASGTNAKATYMAGIITLR